MKYSWSNALKREGRSPTNAPPATAIHQDLYCPSFIDTTAHFEAIVKGQAARRRPEAWLLTRHPGDRRGRVRGFTDLFGQALRGLVQRTIHGSAGDGRDRRSGW